MGIYAVKPRFRRLLRGTARSLAARGVTPDQVTTAGIVASGLGALAFRLGGRWRGAFVAVPVLAMGALAAAELSSFVGVSAKAAGGRRRYDGPMGKPDRMLVVGVAGLAAAATRQPARVLNASLAVVAAGALATAANRYRRAHAELDASGG